MTLAQLKTAIDATIGGLAGLVTKARHKSANDVIADTFFSEIVQDTQATTNVFTKTSTSITYWATAKKMGNRVDFVFVINNSGGGTITSSTELLKITDAEYLPKALTGQTSYFLNGMLFGGSADIGFLQLRSSDGKIFLGTNMASATYLYVQGFYFTED